MRTLIISDIHANLTAFEAVLEAAGEFERVWFLGDVVGYGPDPNECIELLRKQPKLQALMGNHDAALLDFIPIDRFNSEAKGAIQIQHGMISEENKFFLETMRIKLLIDDLTLVHGSPQNPIWEYILNYQTAKKNFQEFSTRGCLVGHSHIQCIFILTEDNRIQLLVPEAGDRWKAEGRFILNPGSVGQPRNLDPRASFVIWDDETDIFEFKRAEYDIESVAERIRALGIPERQAERLFTGS